MRLKFHPAAWCIVAALVSRALGHGTPIHVEVVDNALAVSAGLPDSIGFAPMVFAEDDEDGDPLARLMLPSVGTVVLWEIPGFDLMGLDNESSLSIDIIQRPVKDSNPPDERVLWYWNPTTELVEPAPAALYLLGTGQRFTTLEPTDTDAPGPFLLADPVAGHQGFHNHMLLKYGLDDSPVAPVGAYGFFARLTSDVHFPSDPFLIVLNRGVAFDDVVSAALAINAAAADPAAMPVMGDYDGSGEVEMNDFELWKLHFGEARSPLASPDGSGNGIVDAADYTVWRDTLGGNASGASAAVVPEPRGLLLVLMTFEAWRWRRRRFLD